MRSDRRRAPPLRGAPSSGTGAGSGRPGSAHRRFRGGSGSDAAALAVGDRGGAGALSACSRWRRASPHSCASSAASAKARWLSRASGFCAASRLEALEPSQRRRAVMDRAVNLREIRMGSGPPGAFDGLCRRPGPPVLQQQCGHDGRPERRGPASAPGPVPPNLRRWRRSPPASAARLSS